MANNKINEPPPFVELTAAAKLEMVEIGKALERSESAIASIKEAGFNVDKMEEMLEGAKKMRNIVLKELT